MTQALVTQKGTDISSVSSPVVGEFVSNAFNYPGLVFHLVCGALRTFDMSVSHAVCV